jgi:CO/xanthine dehydrogenase Mo-binding subunit
MNRSQKVETVLKDSNEYIADFSVKGMIHAVTIRSPVARGTLREIVPPELPDSFRLITAEHIPGVNQLADFPVPVLADKNLSYIGQPVAILAGSEESSLEDLASKIVVTAEEAPPSFADSFNASEDVIVKREIQRGELSGEGGKLVSGIYISGIQEHWYAEPHGAAVVPANKEKASAGSSAKGKGKKTAPSFTVYTATQWPSHVRRSVAQVLGWEDDRVTVNPTLMIQHLDGKLWYPSLVSCHAALAAWITKHPVKLMLTRKEDFMYTPKRNSSKIEIYSELGEKGEILNSSIGVTVDLGSLGVFEDEIIDQTCLGSLGLYRHKAFKISAAGIRTNIAPQGPMAGFGLSQGIFAAERHVSRIADSIGQDPAEWRKKNLIQKNQSLGIGTELKDPLPLSELIDAAASMSDYNRKWVSYELLRSRRRKEKRVFSGESLRGIGISLGFQGSGFLYNNENSNCSVELTLEKDGFLEIKTSLVSSGSGQWEAWQNLAGEILGVDPAYIRLTGNTEQAPNSGPGTLSRNICSVTGLIERCCMAIRKQRFRNPLPITVKRSEKTNLAPGWIPEKNIDPETFTRPSWGAAVVEIEIDPVSLESLARGIWLVVDGGKILSRQRARKTLTIGIIQALGWACCEKLSYIEGGIPPEYFRNYNIPAPEDIPPIFVDFLTTDTAVSKGIGDLPFSCVPAAYVQAVSQAMDHHFEKIPLDVHEIWDAMELNNTE